MSCRARVGRGRSPARSRTRAWQYVLLGAGLDSFCVRQPDFAHALAVFEVDHPASQASKRASLAGTDVPPNVRFVAADLAREDRRGGSRRWASVRRAELLLVARRHRVISPATRTRRRCARLRRARGPAARSRSRTSTSVRSTGALQLDARRTQRAAQGEPWLSGFDPTTLADDLRRCGSRARRGSRRRRADGALLVGTQRRPRRGARRARRTRTRRTLSSADRARPSARAPRSRHRPEREVREERVRDPRRAVRTGVRLDADAVRVDSEGARLAAVRDLAVDRAAACPP